MNRRHTAKDYLTILDRLRAYRPDIALSGDFIVGFPGETDRDFADTLKLVDQARYAAAYSFKYSPRPGTPAAGQTDQVEASVSADRLAALQQLLDAWQLAFNKQTEGSQMDILIEKSAGRPGQLSARSPYMQSVYLDGSADLIGQILPVVISKAGQNSVQASLLDAKGAA
jgi:tRNA-2-methylthio-N6-dimethylallyladenosine synthase